MIPGLTAKDPIGVIVSMGIKGPKGNPIDKDRFHLVEVSQNKQGIRPLHPRYHAFNTAEPVHRRSLRGVLVHANVADCVKQRLKLHAAPKEYPGPKTSPDRRPFCSSDDGKTAKRYLGNEGFQEIPCPAERCEFYEFCKPTTSLMFQLNLKGSPGMLARFDSGGWRTASHVLGFFEHVETAAKELRIENYSLFGLPFMLTLTMETAPKKGAEFPVARMVPEDFSPVEFFLAQRAQLAQLGTDYQEPLGLTDESEQSVTIEAENWDALSGPNDS